MSTPAQNPRPSARTTTACTSVSAPASRTRRASSNHADDDNALTGGTSMTTSATCSESVRVIPMGEI